LPIKIICAVLKENLLRTFKAAKLTAISYISLFAQPIISSLVISPIRESFFNSALCLLISHFSYALYPFILHLDYKLFLVMFFQDQV
jgi:hypothetical protein